MSQLKINIVPTDTLKVNSVNSFTIANFNVSLFNTAYINVILNDASGNFVQSVNITLTKDEYNGWVDDDNYILNLVATKLGFTLSNTAVANTPTGPVVTSASGNVVTK